MRKQIGPTEGRVLSLALLSVAFDACALGRLEVGRASVIISKIRLGPRPSIAAMVGDDGDVAKLSNQRFRTIDDLDDLVGLRVICLSSEHVRAWSDQFIKMLYEHDGAVAQMIPIVDASVKRDEILSSAGYSATHIRFLLQPPSSYRNRIACEVQVRTIFQDAWATVSHVVQYKSSPKRKSLNSGLLSELSSLRDAADKMIDKLR